MTQKEVEEVEGGEGGKFKIAVENGKMKAWFSRKYGQYSTFTHEEILALTEAGVAGETAGNALRAAIKDKENVAALCRAFGGEVVSD